MDPACDTQATKVMQRDDMASMPTVAQLSACVMVRRPRHQNLHRTSIHPLTAYTALLFAFSVIGLWSLMEMPHGSRPLIALSTELDGPSFPVAEWQVQSGLPHQVTLLPHGKHLDQDEAAQQDVQQLEAALPLWPGDTKSSYTPPLGRR